MKKHSWLDIIPVKLWWICFICFVMGMVISDLSEINMGVSGILVLAFGFIVAFFTPNKKIMRNR